MPQVIRQARDDGVRGRARSARAEGGIALVLVLWVVALLAVLAASQLVDVRATMGLAGNQVAAAQARALAEAGINRAIAALDAGHGRLLWPTADTRVEWRFGGGAARIRVQSESGKLNLNSANATYLQRLLQAAGLRQDEAAALIDAIQDYRDRDSLRRPNGAEIEEYAAAGLTFGPKNGSFAAVEELQQVLGMSPALYARLQPHLTVHSRPPHMLDPQSASAELLEMLGLRRQGDRAFPGEFGRQGLSPQMQPLPESVARRIAGVYDVYCEARVGGITQGARAIVAIAIGAGEPYRFLDWREGIRNLPEPQA